ncbi:branched-chain amino acid transport system ATP-binding protein [Palleronia aestuarii]|uniref:Branched-chain amino acid transport system ATP-binding protein n=1 Tax=Palleronia aestuarii TaxID=568105 RepID=A0A2W7Q5J6_9RHOB|nr:hypothetical protein [Palleronia aestuarii]PZX16989.1 branched-chain amino acid transport system ATP-binding protein [Palleronia aestuarii]
MPQPFSGSDEISPRDTKDVTVILVEQNVGEALAASDQAHVLDHGRIVRSWPAAELVDDPAIQKAYMG